LDGGWVQRPVFAGCVVAVIADGLADDVPVLLLDADAESYGVDSHPQRLAGLHGVARALICYLDAVYDVEVHENPAYAAELLREARDVLQAVKVTPRRPGGRPRRLC
jgi:hypothetical protein